MSSLAQQDLWEEWFREFAPGFQALSPYVRYSKRARVSYNKDLACKAPAELLCTGFCRNPVSIQPWEQKRECRSLDIATGQARQYNTMLGYPAIPQEMLQDLLQDSISPCVLKSRRNMQGCRIVTCSLQRVTVIVTAGGARGHLLLVTTMPEDRTKPHDTVAFKCMSCSIFELKLEPRSSPNAHTPLHPACRSDSEARGVQHASNVMPRLAVRHSLGLSIYQLQAPQPTASSKAALIPLWYIPAAMEVVALHWSLFLPGQLLYTCTDLCTYAVSLGSQSDASRLNLGLGTKCCDSTTQQQGKVQTGQESTPEPSLVVVAPGSGVPCSSQGDIEDPAAQVQEGASAHQPAAHTRPEANELVAIAVLAHPQRVYLATGSSIYVAEMSLLQGSRPSVWQPFIEIESSFGPISSIATPPWYQASCPRTAELLRHMLFVGCKESVFAYHIASPATRVLCTSMPPHVKQGSILRVDTWQHCLSFEDKDTVRRTKHDTSSFDFKTDISHGVWGDGHASEFCTNKLGEEYVKVCPDVTGQVDDTPNYITRETVTRETKPRGVVALGQVVGMCENDGSMFMCPFVVSAALRGLVVRSVDAKQHDSTTLCASNNGDLEARVSTQSVKRRISGMLTKAAGDTSGAGAEKSYSGRSRSSIQAVYVRSDKTCRVDKTHSASCSARHITSADVQPTVQPAADPVEHDSSSGVQMSACKRLKSVHDHHDKQETDCTNFSMAASEAYSDLQKSVPLPWVFAESSVAQWLGTPLVFGFPIKEHLHSVPQLNTEVAVAEAACTLITAKRLDDRVDDEIADASRRVGVEKHDVLLPVTLKEPGFKQRAREKFRGTNENVQNDVQAAFVADVMGMHEVCFDNAGCAVQWSENEGFQHNELADCKQSDLIAGALRVEELIASGNGTELYEALLQRAPQVTCIRSSCAGTPIVEKFEWRVHREQQLSPNLPEGVVCKMPSGRQRECLEAVKALQPAAALAGVPPAVEEIRTQKNTENHVKPAAGLQEGASTFTAWSTGCVTCSVQLHNFVRCWSHSQIRSAAAKSPTSGDVIVEEPRRHSMTNMFSWQATDPCSFEKSVVHSDVAFLAPDEHVGETFVWPYDDARLTDLTQANTAESQSQPWRNSVLRVFEQLVTTIQNATTVAELWAAVLHLLAMQFGAPEVVAHEQKIENAPNSSNRKGQKQGRERAAVEDKRCCPVQRSVPEEELLCCREAEWSSVRAREIHGDMLQLNDADVREACALNSQPNSARLEEGRTKECASGKLLFQTAVKCCSLPGRLITGYRTVHVYATKRKATDVNAELENSRILLRLHLKTQCAESMQGAASSGSAQGAELSSGDILSMVVAALKALGPRNKLLHVQDACWYQCPSVTSTSTIRHRWATWDSPNCDSGRTDYFARLHNWIVLPVGQSIDNVVNSAHHKLWIDSRVPPVLTEEVQNRVAEVLEDWQ